MSSHLILKSGKSVRQWQIVYNGSLGIAVIKNFFNTDYMDGHGSHGFLIDFSVRFREIRPIRVQNHGNSWRACTIKGMQKIKSHYNWTFDKSSKRKWNCIQS